ncbi:hypothetical protein LY90DRAFT_506523 [Neocallimastix californiae]|uniref:Uncharacterized protein n=1 Tax=Neocallimastix californiae TaxID=1754190 RepID=A0A1Y2DDP8_9FUNG|nr:hypothetical protein LY90DRAFT_506523 [Neocallimastix californiae]|eukprot:ORY57369.1 hypothetical protein LY90DRAFT_506523 [Neocallimastix californiae]
MKKINPNTVKNELLQFEQYLTNNLANTGRNSTSNSMPNLFNDRYNNNKSQRQLFSSNRQIFSINENEINSTSKINEISNSKLGANNANQIIDTKEIKSKIDFINILNDNNLRIYAMFYSNISKLKEITDINCFTSISSYFSNWANILIKFFKQFSIEYDIPSCPDYIEKLKIHRNYGSQSENIYDTDYNSDVNNIKNCIFSLYKWNSLF